MRSFYLVILCSLFISPFIQAQKTKFNQDWLFKVDTSNDWDETALAQKEWRKLNVPHDWSIELEFDETSPSGARGAALRGGLGLYQKHFQLNEKDREKLIFIQFDGIYMNSTVKINGHSLGHRPNGYISFEYDMTPFLKFDGSDNVLEVSVENKQPNSRWYSGSGIYRNVWLDKRPKVHIRNWGTFIQTTEIKSNSAQIQIDTELFSVAPQKSMLQTEIFDPNGVLIQTKTQNLDEFFGAQNQLQQFNIQHPKLWSIEKPNLYVAVHKIILQNEIVQTYETVFGIRSFRFDAQTGFYLNDQPMKIVGVNMHHDLGALGAAINVSAMKRQLKILKAAGFNGLRTAHNPPAPELLDLCDQMGFIVMDETFDVWRENKENTDFNYHLYFDQWMESDLRAHIQRDRNHPSVFIWSIGNEIPEQSSAGNYGKEMTAKMVEIVKSMDRSRVVSAGMNYADNRNQMYQSDALDVIGVNYNHLQWADLGTNLFPSSKPFLLTENVSAIASRGEYHLPSSEIRRWSGFSKTNPGGSPDFTCSAYENCSVPWGSTNEEALKILWAHPFLSGMYIWTGFDYLGEPTPYSFPARSSYFGVVDMAGFPKDSYYLYQSLLSDQKMLHILPHWNWTEGEKVDVHVYFNQADVVELYLNHRFIGQKSKESDDLFVRFDGIEFQAGTLEAISKKNHKIVMQKEVKTAGEAYKIRLELEDEKLSAHSGELGFVKVSIVDQDGNLVPNAHPLLHFEVKGNGEIKALDNGHQTDLTSFANKTSRRAYNGLALAIIQATDEKGEIELIVHADGLKSGKLKIQIQ